MTRIIELIDDFKLIQEIIGRKPRYIQMCILTFNDEDVQRIISDVKEKTYFNICDKLNLIMLFDTGIRVGELCGIEEADISMRHILIRGKGSKQRLVYISKKAMRKYMRKYEQAKQERFKRKQVDDVEDKYIS